MPQEETQGDSSALYRDDPVLDSFSYAVLLTEEECGDVWRVLRSRKVEWRKRGCYYTFGTALTLDYTPETDNYYGAIAGNNTGMLAAFSSLYPSVARALSQTLGAPANYASFAALPGFNIFGARDSSSPEASHPPRYGVHFDGQHHYLPDEWSTRIEDVISFTLPIVLPAAGGGLDVWPLSHADYLLSPELDDLECWIAARPSRFIPYRVGELVVHRALLLHRIARWDISATTAPRVTLQGHGILVDGVWHLYW